MLFIKKPKCPLWGSLDVEAFHDGWSISELAFWYLKWGLAVGNNKPFSKVRALQWLLRHLSESTIV